VTNLLKEMAKYGVAPEVLDQVAEGFQSLETKSAGSSGSEEHKEDVPEFIKDYRLRLQKQ
jgi:hypothetical protein